MSLAMPFSYCMDMNLLHVYAVHSAAPALTFLSSLLHSEFSSHDACSLHRLREFHLTHIQLRVRQILNRISTQLLKGPSPPRPSSRVPCSQPPAPSGALTSTSLCLFISTRPLSSDRDSLSRISVQKLLLGKLGAHLICCPSLRGHWATGSNV